MNPLAGLFDQIENFLFDLLGIVLPGFLLLLILLVPALMVTIDASVLAFNNDDVFIMLSKEVSTWAVKNPMSNSFYMIFLASFILGHVVKVFSKVFYEFFVSIFDKFANKLINIHLNKFGIWLKKKSDYEKWKLWPLIVFFKKQSQTIFVFKPNDYYPQNEEYIQPTITNFNTHYSTHFTNEWMSIYKISKIIHAQENIKSLSFTYLAKYNLYRSLSFLVFFSMCYQLFIITKLKDFPTGISGWLLFVCISHFILWFTFHEKYKRYWMLFGDENLIAFYYFMLKKVKG
jgi:hypothetical protein